MPKYKIVTDDRQMDEFEAGSDAEALEIFGAPLDVRTAQQFVEWVDGLGGYGWIDRDGERVADVF